MCALILLKRVFVSASVGLHLAERWGGGANLKSRENIITPLYGSRGENKALHPERSRSRSGYRTTTRPSELVQKDKSCVLKWVQHDLPLCF